MLADSAAKERAQDWDEVPTTEVKTMDQTENPFRRLPGSSASCAIPPSDSPEYLALQKEFKTDKPLGLLTQD